MSKAVEARLKVGEVTEDPPAGATPPTVTPPAAAAADTPSQTPPTPAVPAADPRHSDPAYWEQRFRVMQGKLTEARELHKAEIDGLETRIADLETSVSEKEQELLTLKASHSPSSSKIDLGQFLTPEDIERIGEDEATTLIAVAQKAIEAHVAKMTPAPAPAPTPAATASKPSDRQTREVERREREARETFLEQLVDLVPDYQNVDRSDGWKAWLAEKKGPRGVERQTVLNAHLRVGDAHAVAAMFEQYRETVAPPPAPITAHAEGGQNEDPAPPQPGALTAPSDKEVKDWYKRAAVSKVSDSERKIFEARMKLRAAAR